MTATYVSYAIVLHGDLEQPHYAVSRNMSKQLMKSAKKYKWPLEIWPATDGSKLPDNYWKTSSIKVSETAGKFLEKKGAWGCLLSHYSLWKHCVAIDRPIIVLEHDAVITDYWQDLDIERGVVKLHTATKTKHKSTVGRWATGTWAYTLTPAQAQMLIDGLKTIGAMGVDKLIGDRIVPWTNLSVDLVVHNPQSHLSTVSKRY